MISFYRPTAERHAIVIEDTTFPSDSYAVRSQAAFHGFDPDTAVMRLKPRTGRERAAQRGRRRVPGAGGAPGGPRAAGRGELLQRRAPRHGVDHRGRARRPAPSSAGIWRTRRATCRCALHDWGVDWAAWCTYKYLNSGPGAIAGRLRPRAAPRGPLAAQAGRLVEHRPGHAVPHASDGRAGRHRRLLAAVEPADLRDGSGAGVAGDVRRGGHGQPARATASGSRGTSSRLLDELIGDRPHRGSSPRAIRPGVAPSCPCSCGRRRCARCARRMRLEHGVVADAREPDVIRLAPAPLYVSYHDCWRAAHALVEVVDNGGK